MALMWRGVRSRFRYGRRRWARTARRAVTAALAAVGFVLLYLAPSRRTPEDRWQLAADALTFFAAALAFRWWRAPDEGLPDALRLRRRSRRIGLRFASLPGVGATVALSLSLAGHGAGAHAAAEAALWLAVAAPVPVVLELALWRLAPGSLRRDMRIGGLVEEIQAFNARSAYNARLVFDPELGHAGRVVPQRHVPRPAVPGEPCAVVPDRVVVRRTVFRTPTFAEERWLVNASIRWDGSALVLTDVSGRRVAAPARPGARSLAADPVELVWVVEQRDGDPARAVSVLLLDAEDRRLLTMPGLGFEAREVARLAAAAGLAFSRYHLRLPSAHGLGHGLLRRMFPSARGHIHLALGASLI